MLGWIPGMESRRGRTAGVVVGRIVMKGSRAEFQSANVPPLAFLFSRAKSG